MIEQLLTEMHNWFQTDVYSGTFSIQDGGVTLPFLQEGQYFRIVGSVFNDGLHRYGPDMEPLRDETFDGAVWALAVPKAVLDLADEIAAWQEKYKDTAESPYTSEAFGGYSYSKTRGADGSSGSWQATFRARMNPYRKLREI